MVRIDDRLRIQYENYLIRHRTFEKIDSAIFINFGNRYKLIDNEVPLHTNVDKELKKRCFETDLVYVTEDRKAVLCIEETRDPSNKKHQLLAYGNISSETLRLITSADLNPYVDVFLICPLEHRGTGLEVYDEIKDEISQLGKKKGISLWHYPPSIKSLKCYGGTFSDYFPEHKSELKSKGIGTFRILKSAPIPFLLQFTVLRALEDEYGVTTEGIEFTKEKLSKWLAPYGIINEGKWREMIKLGKNVGWFENVSLEQFTGTIKYTKVNPVSIAGSKKLTSNFFQAIEEEHDKEQKSLLDFSSDEEDIEDIEEDDDF
jgi:hypothetical protein